jgi:hypothetical protein
MIQRSPGRDRRHNDRDIDLLDGIEDPAKLIVVIARLAVDDEEHTSASVRTGWRCLGLSCGGRMTGRDERHPWSSHHRRPR